MSALANHSSVVFHRPTQAEVDAICARHDRLWQAKPGGARAVFSWTDLSGLDLRGRNLTDADFTGALLVGTDLTGARLDHATLYGADLQGAVLVEASLRRADLRGACLRACDLTGADLFEADLREGAIAEADRATGYRKLEHVNRTGDLQGAVLAGANLQRSKLSGVMAMCADFTDAVMRDCKLVRANLKSAQLAGADLAGADLSGADLSGADLTDCVLVGAKTALWNVSKANLAGVLTDAPAGTALDQLPYAQMLAAHARWCESGGREGAPSVFDGADLRGLKSVRGLNLTALSAQRAIFYGVDLEGVQLQGARLEGADFRGCNLRRADLRGAKLMGAKLSGADLRESQLGPLLIGEDRLMPADLRGANLKGADLSGADLRRAVLIDADLQRANLTGAMTRGLDVAGAMLGGVKGLSLIA